MIEVYEFFGEKLPTDINETLKSGLEKYQILFRSYQHTRIIEDRIWHLLNTFDYCDYIKRAFLVLRNKQLV